MAQATSTSLAADVSLYIRDELLDIAERNVVFAQHALMAPLPRNNGKTCQFSRYPRVALPMTPAIEGQTPASVAIAVETVQAITDQWILVVEHTDLAEITIKHPVVSVTTELLGLAQAELVDREIQQALMAGSSVVFANAVAGSNTVRADLATTDVVNSTEMRKLWAILSRNGARRIGVNYVFICDPEVSQDISATNDFMDAHQLGQAKQLFNNVIGSWLGFDIEVSNFIPTVTLGGSGDWTVAAGTVTGETFTNGDTVFVRLEAINSSTGLVEKVFASKSTTVTTTQGVLVTVPSTVGFLYNVYVSNTNNTDVLANFQLFAEAQAPGTIVSVGAFPTASASAQRPQQAPASGVTVHTSYAIGKEAYGMVKLSGDNLRVLMTDGKPSDSDPAAQRRKISLKGSFKAVVLNPAWVQRLESASSF